MTGYWNQKVELVLLRILKFCCKHGKTEFPDKGSFWNSESYEKLRIYFRRYNTCIFGIILQSNLYISYWKCEVEFCMYSIPGFQKHLRKF